MSDQNTQTQSRLAKKQNRFVWRQAEHQVTAATIILLVFLAIFIIGLAGKHNNTRAMVSVPTPSPTATPTLTPTPNLVSVTYHLVADSDDWLNLSLDLWYSNGPKQHNQEQGRRIRAGDSYLIELQVSPGTFLELFAAMQRNQSGEVTCRIVVAGKVIQENRGRGQGAGVYCEGLANP